MSKDIPGTVTDLSTMAADQQAMFGVHTFNVKAEEEATENSVKVPVNQTAIDTSVNSMMTKDAPNLPFDLPFHIQRFFGGSVPKDSGKAS